MRRLTPSERDRNEEQEQARYDELFAQIEEEQRLEYSMEFGPEYRAAHPFTPYKVHERVVSRMRAETVGM
jgi:hypothetical protein